MVLSQRGRHFSFKEKVLGQYFTPSVVSDFIVSFASLHLKNRVSACDPACGDGVFLNSMVKYGFKEVVGIDLDGECVRKVSGVIKEGVDLYVGDALRRDAGLGDGFSQVKENYFDLVAGNPPFSAKYGRVSDQRVLSCYGLGVGRRSQAVEVLFLERFIQLARVGGVVGIILPDGVLLNLNYRGVREFILNNCRVLAVISLPRSIFNSRSRTVSKTSILFLLKGGGFSGDVFTAIVESLDELPAVLEAYRLGRLTGFCHRVSITADSFHPRSYLVNAELNFNFPSVKLGSVVDEVFCGSTVYGVRRMFTDSGLRFISAKTVTRLGLDFTKDERCYIEAGGSMDKLKAHVRVGDVLFVRVGVGCIGRAAVVVDERDLGVVDDWIYVIRSSGVVSPYYLTVFLQSKYGRIQLEQAMRGVGTVTIPLRLLKEFVIPIPDIGFQDSFRVDYLRMVDYRRSGDYASSERIFSGMLNRLEEYFKNCV
ncbi:MAG: N-6 DNA methylase [Candidatus Odinarchaeum yellowstonii]|uniref:N-6 DNA methylase n=1 Tax=Odinarchaeota yellowstonii (strain LCB_4) TaxID=1841599 RepID=A0AAF0IAU4_ODILC|nr:MAG: N-6 DNA methylase [Candidatus Odinarchaeum yellowstonii]